ncbi:hypothetical protein [Raoultella sp. Lac1]|uniref:hypothetical protein n=2 Tax=Raoultella TaxID=160674 RepID=UPI001D11A3BA
MNISTVNEIIQSLESVGELSIKERKYLDLAKAYQQLAAENVGLKVMNDCLSEELRGYESDGAFDGPNMHLLWWQVETPATNAAIAGIKAAIEYPKNSTPSNGWTIDPRVLESCSGAGWRSLRVSPWFGRGRVCAAGWALFAARGGQMKPLKFQQVQDVINAITTDWSIRGPFHDDDGKYYAMLHGEWIGDGYLNKRKALDAIYAALREGADKC